MSGKYVRENLEIVVKNAVEAVPALLEVRLFGGYHKGCHTKDNPDVDVMVLTADESLSGLNFLLRDEARREEITESILINTDYEFRRNQDLKLVSLFDMGILIGRDEGRGDIGKAMYNGELFYRRVPINPVKLSKYLWQRISCK